MDVDIPQAPDQTSFKLSGVIHQYNVFTAEDPDPSMGSTGDICVSSLPGSAAAFIRQDDQWIPADLRTTTTKGIPYPNCRHPLLPIMRLRFDTSRTPSYYWCNSSYFRTAAGRGKKGEISGEDSQEKATLVKTPATAPTLDDLQRIEQLIKRWTTPPLVHIKPTHVGGIAILQSLRDRPEVFSLPSAIVQYPIHSTSPIRPTLSHVLTDLLASTFTNRDVIDFSSGAASEDLESVDVISSLILSTGTPNWPSSKRLYGLMSIPASRFGLDQCALAISDEILTTYRSDPVSIDDDTPAWFSTLLPAGAIIQIHIDFHGAGQYITHVHGVNLWIFWEPTIENLSTWSQHHFRIGANTLTSEMLKDLTKATAIILDRQTTFFIPPYYLHATVAFEPSAHSAVRLWTLDGFSNVKPLLNWELDWLFNASANGTTASTIATVSNEYRDELGHWKKLLDMDNTHEEAEMLREWIEGAEKSLARLKLSLEAQGKRKRR